MLWSKQLLQPVRQALDCYCNCNLAEQFAESERICDSLAGTENLADISSPQVSNFEQ